MKKKKYLWIQRVGVLAGVASIANMFGNYYISEDFPSGKMPVGARLQMIGKLSEEI